MIRIATILAVLSVLLPGFVAVVEPVSAKTGHETVPEVSPAWSQRFEGRVLWQRVTPMGSLVVSASSGLYGVDPDTGKITWRHLNMKNLSEERYEEIPGTPFVVISDGTVRPMVAIVDSFGGRVVFDSRAAGITKVLSKHVLPLNRGLLIVGFDQGDATPAMFMYDIASGRARWKNAEVGLRGTKRSTALTAIAMALAGVEAAESEPLEINGEEFLIVSGGQIYKIATRTGEVRWRITDLYGVRDLALLLDSRRPDHLFVGAEVESGGSPGRLTTYYSAYRLSDGGKIWPEPVKVKGGLNEVIFVDHGMIISPRTTSKGKIKLVDYDSGRSLWGNKGRGIDVTGGIVDYDFSDAGIILTTGYDSAWTDKGAVYLLNILDERTGTLRFPKSLKLEGRVVSTEVIPKGVLYITTSEVNILDPRTGRPLYADSIESKDSLITTTRGNHLYAFSRDEGALYRIDKRSGTRTKLSRERVKLQGDEVPVSLEVRDDGFVVASSQNLVGFAPNGATRFHVYYPAPRRAALMRALLRAEAIRAGMASFVSGATGGAFAVAASEQKDGSVNQAIAAGMAQGYAEASGDLAGVSRAYWQAAKTRFTASAMARDFVFMMVQFRRGEAGLAKVSKTDGSIVGMINLKDDKEPSYQVDGITNQIYYRVNPTQVVGYRF